MQKIVDFALTELDNRRILYEPSSISSYLSNSSKNNNNNNLDNFTILHEVEKESITNKPIYAEQSMSVEPILNSRKSQKIWDETDNVK